MDRQQYVIRRITAHVIAYRFQLENERNSRMAIEIKGLKADALLARANIDRVRAAYARFNQAAPAHADDVDKLASDITGMQSDLEFAATVMGNSADASEKLPAASVERQNVQAGSGDSNVPKALPEGTAATSVGSPAATETTDRITLGPHPDQPGLEGIVDADKIRAQVNKAAAQDTAEVGQEAVATFRAAE